MLSGDQIDEYDRVGAIVVPEILSRHEGHLLRDITDSFVQRAPAVTAHNEIYDLEDNHTSVRKKGTITT
jgi:hypothetical protein